MSKPKINIDRWEWSSERSRPIKKSYLAITKSDGQIVLEPDQPPPLIPFDVLFQRSAENNKNAT
ncbi:uncharacterized protein N7529_009515 [Penicillium soppii]|jgi:hypothetical protein|uniref:uncharacterized protein n=1 Tax=Penicillium soppii TaxID=69789 RepID=UPI00254894B2|nr:uncharacterized protein N7529_009515 [Penicillium soppii]KAJ5855571.1 hypothetical protein N7529_009515 [Penicillium soppii]